MAFKSGVPELKLEHGLLRIGLTCNENCLFCNAPRDSYPYPLNLSINQIKKLIDNFAKSRPERISITGGEPTLRPDLERIIKYAAKKGIKDIEIQTNAILLANNKRIKIYKKAGLTIAFVSLHASTPELNDYIVQRKGAFQCATEGIKNLLKNKVTTEINIVINSINYRNLPDFVSFVNENFPGIRLCLSVAQPHWNALKNRFIIPDYDKISPYLKKAIVSAQKYGLNPTNPFCGVPPCIGEWYNNLTSCMDFSTDLNFKIREKEKARNYAEKIKAPKCKKCCLNSACTGVWKEYPRIHGFSALRPIKKSMIKNYNKVFKN